MISSFKEVEQDLQPYVDHNSGEYTVAMTARLARHVGNPEERLKVIHAAGTSGKTSTCYYIRQLLERAGQKTGLTVSPHIETIADRVQVGGKPLAEDIFCQYFDRFLKLINDFAGQPSYFEVMMVFALWVFDQEQVDYAVIETGLGGLHDSSNICRRADKLCVLTDIGFDHMNVLGTTLAEITQQKVGIVAPGNHLLTYPKSPEITEVIERFADKVHYLPHNQPADYRQHNFYLALAAYQFIANRDHLPRIDSLNLDQLSLAQVPGRLEAFVIDGKRVILDGAHNRQKMEALIRTFNEQFPGVKPIVILAMKQGKEYQEVIALLKPLAEKIIVSQYDLFQDTRLGSISPGVLAEESLRQGIATEVSHDLSSALEIAKINSDFTLVTGSLYAVSEIRQIIA